MNHPDGITRTDQLLSAFKEANVKCIFPLDYLLEKKKTDKAPFYYETDTHWNDLGAYYAFEKIREEIVRLFPNKNFPNIEYKRDFFYRYDFGGTINMLNIKQAKSTHYSLTPINGNLKDYFKYITDYDTTGLVLDTVITIGKDSSLPRAVVFRDSFIRALRQYLSPMFSSTEYYWHRMTENDKKKILANKPDLIIFEIVERHAIYIAKRN